jgi:hypothetical protein
MNQRRRTEHGTGTVDGSSKGGGGGHSPIQGDDSISVVALKVSVMKVLQTTWAQKEKEKSEFCVFLVTMRLFIVKVVIKVDNV